LQAEDGAIVGEAANPQIAQSVAAALGTMPDPYRAAWIITPAGAPALRHVPDVSACAAVVRAAQGAETLRFDREGAAPSPLTAVALRDQGLIDKVKGCVFTYGVFDLSGTEGVRSAGPGTLLFNGPTMQADLARLAPDRDEEALRRPDVSPLYADLEGLPPALFLAGEYDPLFEDSLLMATRWGEAAVADLIRVPEAPHGFLHFGGPAARGARAAVRHWLNRRLKS